MVGWRNIHKEDRGGPDCPRLRCTAWFLRSNFLPNSCVIIPAMPLPLLGDTLSPAVLVSVWQQRTSFCSSSTFHSFISGTSAALFPLSVTLSLSPVINLLWLTSLPSGWGLKLLLSGSPPSWLQWDRSTSTGNSQLAQGLSRARGFTNTAWMSELSWMNGRKRTWGVIKADMLQTLQEGQWAALSWKPLPFLMIFIACPPRISPS